jgi:pantothenate kinase type III
VILADLGGRKLKLAVPDQDGGVRLLYERAWPTQPGQAELAELGQQLAEHGGPLWLSSSRPSAARVLQSSAEIAAQLRVVAAAQVPIARTTSGTGSDRLLAALAASHRANGACLIADLGTAWTLDCVDGQRNFRGGAIGPGMSVQVDALAIACPHLDAPASEDPEAIPNNTATAVRAGTLLALAASLQGLAESWQATIGPAPRYLTGGDAALLAPVLGPDWLPAEHLVLQGLAIAAEQWG